MEEKITYSFGASLEKQIIPTIRWKLQHHLHVEPGEDFKEELLNDMTSRLVWLICPCNARHLTVRQ